MTRRVAIAMVLGAIGTIAWHALVPDRERTHLKLPAKVIHNRPGAKVTIYYEP
jgi:hypothetical protein